MNEPEYWKEEKYVVVTDDWYPCYEGNKILLFIFLTYNPEFPSYSFVRIAACGADDFYLAVDYHNDSKIALELMYLTWAKHIFDEAHDGINRQWFLARGLEIGV